jgi:hypothetical protein
MNVKIKIKQDIFQIEGNLNRCDILFSLFDEESLKIEDMTNYIAELIPDETVLITDCLGKYFIKLPESLIPFKQYQDYILVSELENENEKIEKIKSLVNSLSEIRYQTLQFLILFFVKVDFEKEVNKTSIEKISEGNYSKNKKVFAPILFRQKDGIIQNNLSKLESLLSIIIRNSYLIFEKVNNLNLKYRNYHITRI